MSSSPAVPGKLEPSALRRAGLPLLFAAIAVFVMLPELFWGTSYSHSRLYNVVWGEQVVELMRHGTLYPRWLPRSWDGMGSPTFYFYSPLFFLLAGMIGAILPWIPASSAVALASATLLTVSGLGMRHWLRGLASERAATLGGLAFMLAPYHLHDIYNRGALAETTTYAVLPFILIALRGIKLGNLNSVCGLALAYAFLLLGHLPVALLATVTIIPAYVLWQGFDGGKVNWRYFGLCLAGGVAGLGISAAFLLPAMGLMLLISSDQLFTSFYRPHTWFFFSGPNSIFSPKLLDFVAVNVTLATAYLLVSFAAWRNSRNTAGIGLWAALGLACFLLVSGLVPFVWDLPGLSSVQFPSRLLVVTEFAAITALVSVGGRLGKFGGLVGGLLLGVGAVIVANMVFYRVEALQAGSDAEMRSSMLSEYRDAPEYLPRGYPIGVDDGGRAAPGNIILPKVPVISVQGEGARIVSVSPIGIGGIEAIVSLKKSSVIEARRLWFPNWRVEDLTLHKFDATGPSPKKLVSWRAEPGVHHFRLTAGVAPFEQLGYAISAFSLLLIAAFAAIARIRPSWLTRR